MRPGVNLQGCLEQTVVHLACITCQVRGAANITAEREARALAALEKSSAERAAALAAREKLLQEREDKVRLQPTIGCSHRFSVDDVLAAAAAGSPR